MLEELVSQAKNRSRYMDIYHIKYYKKLEEDKIANNMGYRAYRYLNII